MTGIKDKAERARMALDAACKPHYCDGRWGAYRAWERGESVPKSVEDALNAYNAAMHAHVSTWPSTVKAFPQ